MRKPFFPRPYESILIYLLVMVLNFALALLLDVRMTREGEWESSLLLNHTGAFGLVVLGSMLVLKKREGSAGRLVAKGDFCWCMTASIISLTLLALVVLWPLATSQINDGNFWFFSQLYTSRSPYLFLGLVMAGPILEEIVFRGIILQGSLHYMSPGKAIVLSAVLFALSHTTVSQIMIALIVGTGIGWLCYKTESIIPGYIVHVTFNLGNYLMRFIYSDEQINELLQGTGRFITGVNQLIIWAVATGLLLLVGYYLVRQVRNHTRPLTGQ